MQKSVTDVVLVTLAVGLLFSVVPVAMFTTDLAVKMLGVAVWTLMTLCIVSEYIDR